ncbi:hypothetical protein ASE37_20975 [Rhizobium sp. Root268]|nr:hypothetical protein ASC86_21685 [Rhizobium sp. Root1212]KRD35576.1 hypothetical protein ASE37_20975 [Rhizobium sp. Root268]
MQDAIRYAWQVKREVASDLQSSDVTVVIQGPSMVASLANNDEGNNERSAFVFETQASMIVMSDTAVGILN